MSYSSAFCRSCNTWQTVLVGYSGSRVCLACGEEIERRGAEAVSLTPAAGALWAAHDWARGASLPHEQRVDRLRWWLKHQSLTLPDEHLAILAHCESASEVRFALPILTLSTWHPAGERSFTDGNWTLRVQHPVLGQPADFVLDGPGASRPLVIEIDPAAPADAELQRAERLRTLQLQAEGYGVLRVPAASATDRGTHFRRAFMRQALEWVETTPAMERKLKPLGTGVARTRRAWSSHDLVYNAEGRTYEQRREMVEDWLGSRGEALEPWQLDFLGHCERAGEVHFALPFLRLRNAEPTDSRTVHLDPMHTLQAQVPRDDHTFDFLFTTVVPETGEVAARLIDVLPARGGSDRMAERRRLAEWERHGLDVLTLPAAEARKRGEQWAESLRRELERLQKEVG